MSKRLFETSGALRNDDVSHDIKALAGALAALHGDVTIAKESSGVHLYMACPGCLEREGTKELSSRHLAVNADRYIGQGKWAGRDGTYNPEWSCMCMKTSKTYSVENLLAYRPLAEAWISKINGARQIRVCRESGYIQVSRLLHTSLIMITFNGKKTVVKLYFQIWKIIFSGIYTPKYSQT